MGATVVVPSEITTKAGSDFDIDKLNLYLKSVYVDKNGDVRLVRYLNSEEATKEFFSKLFDVKLEKKKVSKAEILDALQILDLGLDDPNNLVDKYSELLDILLEDTTTEDRADALLKELEKLGDADLQAALKDRYVDDMYNRALENDYIQSLEDMLTLEENFERRTVPTSDAGLKAESENINTLKGKGKERIKNRLLDGVFMTSARHYFSMGKQWVGIVATNITFQSFNIFL
jgi:ribosomal protein L7/L12